MRVVVQRVIRGEVRVIEPGGDRLRAAVAPGLVALVGVAAGDTEGDAAWAGAKLASLRVFEDAGGKMNLGLAEVPGAGVVLVPNFTVAGSAQQGRRPDFAGAMKPPEAERLFGLVVDRVRAELEGTGVRVETGVFGAYMHVAIVNDGPVTLVIESPRAG